MVNKPAVVSFRGMYGTVVGTDVDGLRHQQENGRGTDLPMSVECFVRDERQIIQRLIIFGDVCDMKIIPVQ